MANNADIFKAVFSVLVFPNLVGNSLVILVLLKSPAMKTPINYLLLNLAVSDLLVGVAMFPRFILSDIIDYPQGRAADIICKIVISGNIGWVGSISSIFSLVLIAIERYLVIVKPLSYRHRITTIRLRILIPITWTVAVLFCFPYFYFSKFDRKVGKCSRPWPNAWFPHTYDVLWLAVAAVLPTSLMVVLYTRVAYFLWSDDSGNFAFQAVRRSRKKVTLTMLALSVVYAVCWFPEVVIHVVSNVAPDQSLLTHWVHKFAISLVVVNSSVNPIVYAFRFEQFKGELKNIVCCCKYPSNSSVREAERIPTIQRYRHACEADVTEAQRARAGRNAHVTAELEVTPIADVLATTRPEDIPTSRDACVTTEPEDDGAEGVTREHVRVTPIGKARVTAGATHINNDCTLE